MKPIRVIRFGITESNRLCSPIWRIWVQGEETYLEVRTMLGVSKVSLHSSGRWVFSAGTSRVPICGPRTLDSLWSAGPRIVFPGIPPKKPIAWVDNEDHGTLHVFGAPPKNHWRDFVILFAEPLADSNHLDKLLPPGFEAIGPMRLRSGRGVWLATFITPMTRREVKFIESERNKFRVIISGDAKSIRAPWATLIQDVENGIRC